MLTDLVRFFSFIRVIKRLQCVDIRPTKYSRGTIKAIRINGLQKMVNNKKTSLQLIIE